MLPLSTCSGHTLPPRWFRCPLLLPTWQIWGGGHWIGLDWIGLPLCWRSSTDLRTPGSDLHPSVGRGTDRSGCQSQCSHPAPSSSPLMMMMCQGWGWSCWWCFWSQLSHPAPWSFLLHSTTSSLNCSTRSSVCGSRRPQLLNRRLSSPRWTPSVSCCRRPTLRNLQGNSSGLDFLALRTDLPRRRTGCLPVDHDDSGDNDDSAKDEEEGGDDDDVDVDETYQ